MAERYETDPDGAVVPCGDAPDKAPIDRRSAMTRRATTVLGLASTLVLVLAACGGGSTSSAPSAAASAAASAGGGGGGAACTASTGAGTVQVSIKGFAFNPAQVTAKVGDVITFTNDDSTGHTATLDDGSCTTETIAAGAAGALSFTAAGSYPFHCKIHPTMTGTITVS
jgi:plastocyanin